MNVHDRLATAAPYLLALTAGTAAAAALHYALAWPGLHIAILILAGCAALQEARIVALHDRLDDALDAADAALGPIAPAYNGEGPWNDAQPVDLNTLTAPAEWPLPIERHRPSPVPRNPDTAPIVMPATEPSGVVLDADFARILDDADEYIARLKSGQDR